VWTQRTTLEHDCVIDVSKKTHQAKFKGQKSSFGERIITIEVECSVVQQAKSHCWDLDVVWGLGILTTFESYKTTKLIVTKMLTLDSPVMSLLSREDTRF
jgi:hypothetical protein